MTFARPLPPSRDLLRQSGLCALAAGAILCLGTMAARAETVESYMAARDRYVADIQKLDADPAKQDAMFALDDKAREDLQKRMMALLGPLAFKGLEKTPRFSPEALYEGDIGSGRPDGLIYADKKDETRIFVAPEAVFANWLAAEAKGEGADPRFREGVKASLGSNTVYTQAVGQDAAFDGFLALPVTAKDGETVYAATGLFSQDGEGEYPPNSIVVARVAEGRVMLAAAPVSEPRKSIAVCSQAYKKAAAKAEQMMNAARKGSTLDDAKIQQAMQAQGDAVTAYRKCFAAEAPKQAFFAPLVARAEALLEKTRGK